MEKEDIRKELMKEAYKLAEIEEPSSPRPKARKEFESRASLFNEIIHEK
ncbi:MAG: hypothetical protein JRH18_08965 [Deltaproteobacteria bacterium]|nr:hypothetical protein [Deltaproteobacteria bacterium]MBW2151784.1 hypothetical protein [Deltaproteobacteria bacterium]